MEYLFIYYPKCSTCQKTKKFLDSTGIKYKERHITDKRPTFEELNDWIKISGYPVKKFFNTSGILYREMGLKNRLPEMSQDEQIKLLSEDGMLVKRPLLIGNNTILVGYNENSWTEAIKYKK